MNGVDKVTRQRVNSRGVGEIAKTRAHDRGV
jgi:hypothetical protein